MVIRQLTSMLELFKASSLSSQLIRDGVGSFALRVSNILLGLALAIVLARALGPEGYGIYAYVFALVSMLAIPAQVGLPRLVLRETAKAQINENWGIMRGIWRWATIVSTVFSITLAVFAIALAWLWAERFSELQIATLFFGLMLVPLISLGNLRGSALQGLHHVIWGQLPELVLRPGLLVFLLIGFIAWNTTEITASQAMAFHVIAAGIAFTIGAFFLFRKRPEPLRAQPVPVYEMRAWLMAAWPLALTAGMQQINQNTDIIMLGFFVSAEDVGIYRVAAQGGLFIIFGLQVVAMFISPYFARLHAQRDHERLQRLVRMGATASFLIALPVFLIFAFWGEAIIRFVFGVSYTHAYIPLMILSFGQLINALFGHIGILLNMTGHELDTARGMAIATVSNIALNLILIPIWGINGAALATAFTLLIWNFILWKSVYNKLGIQSVAFLQLKH